MEFIKKGLFAEASDLHLEFSKVETFYIDLGVNSPENVNLILAGDIHVGPDNIIKVLEAYSNVYKNVIFVAGNHEYYGYSIEDFNGAVTEYCKEKDNVYFLNRDIISIDGIAIAGATGWGEIPVDYYSDFSDTQLIKNSSRTLFQDLHETDMAWVKENADSVDIMITHFCPSPTLGNPVFPASSVTKYFCPAMADFYENTKIWFFGHTHYSLDKVVNNTRYISNQLGYPMEYMSLSTEVIDFAEVS